MEIAHFKEDLLMFANPKHKLKGTDDYWKCLFVFIHKNKRFVVNQDLLQTCCEFVQDRLMECGCGDKDILNKIIKTCSLWCWHGSILRRMSLEESLSVNMKEEVCIVLSPLDLDSERQNTTFISDVGKIDLCIENADVNLMKVLIRYGVADTSREISYYEFRRAEVSLLTFWLHAEEDELGYIAMLDLDVRVRFVKEILCELRGKNGGMNGANKRGFMRILLIVKTLRAITLKRQGDPSANDYIHCLKQYFEIIPEPYISTDEVQEFLQYFFGNEDCDDLVKCMSETYGSLFRPESNLQYTPRSLKDLCRCRVRNILIPQSRVLPVTVANLDIPTILKDFLLGDLYNR